MDLEVVEKAQKAASEYIELLKSWVPLRRCTISELKGIAESLDNIEFGTGVGKVTGAATAVVGGIASVAGIFATGGLATPLVVGGIIGSLAGTATSMTSDIVKDVMSSNRMKQAQSELDKEKSTVEKIEKKKEELDTLVEEISRMTGIEEERVFSALLMASVPRYRAGQGYVPTKRDLEKFAFNSIILSVMLGSQAAFSKLAGRLLEPVTMAMGKTFGQVSIKGFSSIAGSVLKGVAAGVFLAWDFYVLTQTAVELSNGSSSAAATALRNLATELGNQIADVEKLLEELREKADEILDLIKNQFMDLLVTISEQGYATDDEAEDVKKWLESHACPEWKRAFMDEIDMESFALNSVFPLARVAHNIQKIIQENLDEDDDDDDELIITVIAHGAIDTHMQLPCFFHYMVPTLLSVTLYSPWGCAIDATVVHGIATNTIHIGDVEINGEVRPGMPSDWNHLPRDFQLVPTLTFYPVEVGEPCHRALLYLFSVHAASNPNGILIPYFQGEGENLLPYPQIPLWLFCAAVSICSVFFQKKIRIRVAACLSVDRPERETGFVKCNQYCVVDGRKNVCMRNRGSIPQATMQILRPLDDVL